MAFSLAESNSVDGRKGSEGDGRKMESCGARKETVESVRWWWVVAGGGGGGSVVHLSVMLVGGRLDD